MESKDMKEKGDKYEEYLLKMYKLSTNISEQRILHSLKLETVKNVRQLFLCHFALDKCLNKDHSLLVILK
jgi:hypothetical protein